MEEFWNVIVFGMDDLRVSGGRRLRLYQGEGRDTEIGAGRNKTRDDLNYFDLWM